MQHDVKVGTAKVVNPILLTLPFLGIWFFYYAERTVSPFYYWGNWVVVALFFILYILFCRIYDGFLISINRISEIVYSQALASVISDFLLGAFVRIVGVLCSSLVFLQVPCKKNSRDL